jgi:hypothetical protein
MPTVFISNMSKDHDYTKAAIFGVVRPITSGNYPIFKTGRLAEEIIDALSQSVEDDYLLLSGSSVVAGLCMAIWLTKHKKVNLLLHDRRQGAYVPRSLLRDELRLDIERARDKATA